MPRIIAQKRKKGAYVHLNLRERYLLISLYRTHENEAKVGRFMGIDHATVRYWVRKYFNPQFHNKPHGGDKRSIFQVHEYQSVYEEVKSYMIAYPRDPTEKLRLYICELFDRTIQKTQFKELLKKLGWSFKVPVRFQIYKYNFKNIIYYVDYLIRN